jgi:membrane-anchored protein YejM (alkaline phosphatase superfamily)
MKVKRDTWWLRKADLSDKGGIKVIDRIRNFDLKEPFFLFMNLMEMHDPHDNISLKLNWSDSFFRNEKLSEDKVKIIRNSYFRAANKVDLILSELISILKKKELLDNSLLIITSDHGQSLMEKNDFFGHGTFLYDELVKVPLIIRLPFGKKIKIENGYQSTTQIKSFIDNTVNGINTFDSISTDFAFSESYGSLDNELSKHKNEKKYTEVLASVDVPRKAIYCNGFKLSLELKNNKIEEFTKNSLPVNFNDYRDIFDNLKEKIEIFG